MAEATKTVGERDFVLVHYEHDQGFELLLELAKIVVPSIYDALRSSASLEALAAAVQHSAANIGASLHLIPARLQEAGGAALFNRFFAGFFALEREGGREVKRRLSDPKVRNAVFGLRFATTFQVLTWVLVENFGPFFAEISTMLEQLSSEPALGSQESQTSSSEA